MTSSYDDVFSCFLGKITGYDFLTMTTMQAEECMGGWIRATYAKPFVRKLFSSIKIDDNKMEITYELSSSINDEDEEYAIAYVNEVFALGMLIEWLEPKVNSDDGILQMFGGKESNFFSQANHLPQIRALLDSSKKNLRKYIRDYKYADFVLNGE